MSVVVMIPQFPKVTEQIKSSDRGQASDLIRRTFPHPNSEELCEQLQAGLFQGSSHSSSSQCLSLNWSTPRVILGSSLQDFLQLGVVQALLLFR